MTEAEQLSEYQLHMMNAADTALGVLALGLAVLVFLSAIRTVRGL